MDDTRKGIATARSLLFAFNEGRLYSYQRRQMEAALNSLTAADRQVLRDAYLEKREVDWKHEEQAAWNLADRLATAGVYNCQRRQTTNA